MPTKGVMPIYKESSNREYKQKQNINKRMAKEFIVAIELGSSKMTGIAGRKNPDGSMTILAVAKEDSASYIRKGVVYNIDKTAQGLSNIISKLKNILQSDITQVYVGIGGQSIHSVKNTVIKDLPIDAIISQDMVDELMDNNRNMMYPEYDIQNAVTQEYKVDAQYQDDPVGIQAKRLEGNYLNILWRRSFYRNLNKSIENAGISIAELYLAPLVMADNVLSEGEKRAGCVLVDLGAETTTIAVFYRNKLRKIAVIPLGSNNITKDLESLQLEETEAERLKIKYGSAFTDPASIDPTAQIPVDNTRSIKMVNLIDVVESRTLEIIENVRTLIPTEYTEKLLGGYILTGGGCNMPNIENAFRTITKADKVRVAKMPNLNINSKDSNVQIEENGTMCTILSLLAKGSMNCAGRDLNQTLFGNELEDIHQTATVVTSQDLQRKAEEERREREEKEQKEREEKERKEREEKERKLEEEEQKKKEERKKNSWFGRLKTTVTNFGKSLVEADTDNN